MRYPEFFDQIPPIAMRDPLADFLGAAVEGRIEYRYLDAVKLAGHSCPTVAAAFLMAQKGLAALYPGGIPERGAIRVALRGDVAEGTVGVTANVVALITGAAAEGGFKGLGGQFSRKDLLAFDAPIEAELRLEAEGRAVDVSFDGGVVPFEPGFRQTLERALRPGASSDDQRAFAAAFQNRVRQILVECRDDPALVIVAIV